MSEEVEIFVDGATLWITEINFSSNSFRVIKQIKPTKITISNPEKGENKWGNSITYFDIIDFKTKVKLYSRAHMFSDMLRSDPENNNIISAGYDSPRAFETEEEAINYFNSSIQNQLDKLSSYYQTKQKYLTKKLIKI